MSAKWIGYFLDESELKDTELLLAIAIADHADADGSSYPGLTLLSQKIRRKMRQTQMLIKRLESKGYLEVERNWGRGKLTRFQLKKVQSRVHLSEPIKGAFSDTEKGAFSEHKRCSLEHEKVHSEVCVYKELEPFKPLEPLREEPHSEAVAIFIETFPNQHLNFYQQELVTERISDLTRWGAALLEWKANGWSQRNLAGMLNRYDTFIDREKTYGKPSTNFREQREQQAIEERNFFDQIRAELDGADRQLQETNASGGGGFLRTLGPEPDDCGESIESGDLVAGIVWDHP